jgi:lipopolysaccharide export system permease protein
MNIPLTSIWERYIIKNILKMFCLCLFGFYGLYVLINYSSHSSSFHHYNLSFLDIVSYYMYDFITRLDFLVPVALLIACTHTLCSLNVHNELTALLMAGVTYRRILTPLFLLALFFVLLLYASEEFASPLAAKHYRQYEQLRARDKHSKRNHPHIQQIPLADNTSIIFQKYNNYTDEFEDAYWVKSIDDIFRIKSLKPTEAGALGKGVQHLKRNESGNLVITESFDEKMMPEIQFHKDSLQETITDPDGFTLSSLYKKSTVSDAAASEKDARLLTTFYRKLALPLACFLAFLIPAPLCLRFTRTLPTFFIYATSIFSMVVFFLVMNAAAILGERQVISPVLAIWVPCLTFLSIAVARLFYK